MRDIAGSAVLIDFLTEATNLLLARIDRFLDLMERWIDGTLGGD